MKTIYLVTLALLTTLNSHAGPISSGGGGAFICPGKNAGTITSYLLDLWEGENLANLNIKYSNASANSQLKGAVDKLRKFDPALADQILKTAKDIFANATYVKPGVILNPPSDASANYGKEGCQLGGMMYFDGGLNHLVIDPKVFGALATETDKSAAVFHEAYYYLARNMQQYDDTDLEFRKSSTYVRKLTACLFSDSNKCLPLTSKMSFVAKADMGYQCNDDHGLGFKVLVRDRGFTPSDFPILNFYSSDLNTKYVVLMDEFYWSTFDTNSSALIYVPNTVPTLASDLSPFGYNTGHKIKSLKLIPNPAVPNYMFVDVTFNSDYFENDSRSVYCSKMDLK